MKYFDVIRPCNFKQLSNFQLGGLNIQWEFFLILVSIESTRWGRDVERTYTLRPEPHSHIHVKPDELTNSTQMRVWTQH